MKQLVPMLADEGKACHNTLYLSMDGSICRSHIWEMSLCPESSCEDFHIFDGRLGGMPFEKEWMVGVLVPPKRATLFLTLFPSKFSACSSYITWVDLRCFPQTVLVSATS